MKNKDAMRYLNGTNKTVLDRSIGAVLLIKAPQTIVTYQNIIDKVEQNIVDVKTKLKNLQNELAQINESNAFKKVVLFAKLHNQKNAIEQEIIDCEKKINSWEYTVNYYKAEIKGLKTDIDGFCKQLKSENIKPKEITELYYELCESFEAENLRTDKSGFGYGKTKPSTINSTHFENDDKQQNNNKVVDDFQSQPGE